MGVFRSAMRVMKVVIALVFAFAAADINLADAAAAASPASHAARTDLTDTAKKLAHAVKSTTHKMKAKLKKAAVKKTAPLYTLSSLQQERARDLAFLAKNNHVLQKLGRSRGESIIIPGHKK